MTNHINQLNVTAADFDLDAFAEIVNNLRRTRKVIVEADDTQAELEEKLEVAKVNLQKALTDGNFDDMQKYTAEAKRLSNKLGENPALKIQEFDEAVNALVAFVQPKEAAEVVELNRAVGE